MALRTPHQPAAELQALKPLCTGILRLVEASDGDSRAAADAVEGASADRAAASVMVGQGLGLLVDLLFVVGSRPLHRQLLSCLRPLMLPQHPSGQHGPTAAATAAGADAPGQQGRLTAMVAAKVHAAAAAVLRERQQQQGKRQQKEAAEAALLLGFALEAALAHPVLHDALRPQAATLILVVGWGLGLALSTQAVAVADTAADAAPAAATTPSAAELGQGGAGGSTGDVRPEPAPGAAAIAAASVPLPRAVAEGIQGSVSVLYTMLSCFGPGLFQPEEAGGAQQNGTTSSGGGSGGSSSSLSRTPQAEAAVLEAGTALLEALKGTTLAREALSSAAVALCAAAVLPAASAPDSLVVCLAQGLRLAPSAVQLLPAPAGEAGAPLSAAAADGRVLVVAEAGPGHVVGLVDAQLRQQDSSLAAELATIPDLNRVCALRGLLAALPAEVLCAPLPWLPGGCAAGSGGGGGNGRSSSCKGGWMLLRDGALPAICGAIKVGFAACRTSLQMLGGTVAAASALGLLAPPFPYCRARQMPTSASMLCLRWQSAWTGAGSSCSRLPRRAQLLKQRRPWLTQLELAMPHSSSSSSSSRHRGMVRTGASSSMGVHQQLQRQAGPRALHPPCWTQHTAGCC